MVKNIHKRNRIHEYEPKKVKPIVEAKPTIEDKQPKKQKVNNEKQEIVENKNIESKTVENKILETNTVDENVMDNNVKTKKDKNE